MRELNVKEIKEVNGGWILQFLGGWLGGEAMNSAVFHWRGASGYTEFDDTRMAP